MQELTLRQVIAASMASGIAHTRPPLRVRLARRLPGVCAFRDRLFARGGFRAERIRPVVGQVRTAPLALLVLLLSAACAAPVQPVRPLRHDRFR